MRCQRPVTSKTHPLSACPLWGTLWSGTLGRPFCVFWWSHTHLMLDSCIQCFLKEKNHRKLNIRRLKYLNENKFLLRREKKNHKRYYLSENSHSIKRYLVVSHHTHFSSKDHEFVGLFVSIVNWSAIKDINIREWWTLKSFNNWVNKRHISIFSSS